MEFNKSYFKYYLVCTRIKLIRTFKNFKIIKFLKHQTQLKKEAKNGRKNVAVEEVILIEEITVVIVKGAAIVMVVVVYIHTYIDVSIILISTSLSSSNKYPTLPPTPPNT